MSPAAPPEAASELEAKEPAGAPERSALAALLAGAAGIAFAPIFVRLSELPPTATAFHRLFLALPALWLWKIVEDRRAAAGNRTQAPPRRGDNAMLLFAAGLFFAADLALWHWSIRFTSVANATLLANFAPIFVTIAGYLFFAERFSRQFLLGMALAIAGAGILMGQSLAFDAEHVLGDALGLTTAMFYASYILAVSRLRARLSTATIMAWSGLVTCAALLTLTLLLRETLLPVTPEGWCVLLGLAHLSHAGGQSLIAFALARLPAALSSVSLLLQPAIAAVLAWAILAEPLGPWQMTGALVILGGIYLARRGSGSVR
ncbi:MAG TPA: DMT family transporter [Rhodospirillales bacterium]|nr:DMT family transporter [Rhodospirillales bacterium]